MHILEYFKFNKLYWEYNVYWYATMYTGGVSKIVGKELRKKRKENKLQKRKCKRHKSN